MQYILKSMLLAVCIIMTASGAAVPPDGWRAPIKLADQTNLQTEPDVASKGDSVFVAWIDGRTTTKQIYFKRSTNKGFDWQSEYHVTDAGNAWKHLGIAIDQNSAWMYAVWTVEISSGIYGLKLANSSDRGSSWTIVQSLGSFVKEPCPSICVDGNGYVHVAYLYRTAVSHGWVNHGISENHGSTFQTTWLWDLGETPSVLQTSIATISSTDDPSIIVAVDWSGDPEVMDCSHIYKNVAGWQRTWVTTTGCGKNYQIDLIVDKEDSLHLFYIWSDPTYGDSLCHRKANKPLYAWYWSDQEGLHSHGRFHLQRPSAVAYNSNIDVVWQDVNTLYHAKSTNLGDSWLTWNGNKSEMFWQDYVTNFQIHTPSIAAGNERHVVFNSYKFDGQDFYKYVYHLANDEFLLSNSDKATAYNGGRHLAYHPTESSVLHAVYFSQGRPHYSRSSDNGQTWSPYHIFKDKLHDLEPPDSGFYPTVGLIPEISMTFFPCVAYVDDNSELDFRYIKNGVENGTRVYYPGTNEHVGPPSLVTYFDTVFIAFPVWNESSEYTAVKFTKFHYTRPGWFSIYTVDEVQTGYEIDSLGVSITVDGNGNPHIVWCKKDGTNDYEDIFYKWHNGSSWQSIEPVSDQPNKICKFPHTDDHGNQLAVTWCNETDNQIWRKRLSIPAHGWSRAERRSLVGAFAEYPVNAAYDTYVWCEKPSTQFDIRRRSDFYGWCWVSDKSVEEYYCHSQLQRDQTPWDLYTIFTVGSSVPYYGDFAYQQYGVGDAGDPEGHSPLYTVETGEDTASVFCSQRDSNIVYQNYKVDFAGSELVYALPFLEPTFPSHRIKGTVYFEGNRNKNNND